MVGVLVFLLSRCLWIVAAELTLSSRRGGPSGLTRHHSDANETTIAGVRTREGRRIHNGLEYSIYRMQSALHE